MIIPSDLTAKPTAATTQPQASPVAAAVAAAGEEREEGAKDGFGVFGRPAAVTHGQQEEEEGEEVTGEGAKFVSLAELRANRISEKGMIDEQKDVHSKGRHQLMCNCVCKYFSIAVWRN